MIFRQHHDNQYLTVSNALVRDSAVSFKATGLLVLLLSMPDGWEPQAGHLSSLKKDGRDAVEAGLRELEIAGYVVRRWVRQDGGKWEWEAHVYETPVALADRSNPAERTVNSRLARKLGSVSDNGESVMGEPDMGEPVTKKDLRDEVPKEVTTSADSDSTALVLVPMQPAVAGRNELWDVLVELCGQVTTRNEQSRRGKVVKELLSMGVTAAEVRVRVSNYPKDWQLTDTALMAHWSKCDRPAPRRVSGRDSALRQFHEANGMADLWG